MSFLKAISPKNKNLGAGLMENLISFSIITTTISIMIPMFFSQQEANINQKFLTAAISISKEHLDDLRRQRILNIPLGESTTQRENSGYFYDVKQYICTQEPVINADESVTCEITVDRENNLRYILLNIEKNGKQIYKVQTAFTRLR